MSCNCGCVKKVIPAQIDYTLPECGNIQVCTEIVDTRCVVYKGANLTNIGINTGDKLDSILVKLDAAINLLNS